MSEVDNHSIPTPVSQASSDGVPKRYPIPAMSDFATMTALERDLKSLAGPSCGLMLLEFDRVIDDGDIQTRRERIHFLMKKLKLSQQQATAAAASRSAQ